MASAMVTPKVTTVVSSAIAFWSVSSALGAASTASIPMPGRNTAAVRPQPESNQFILAILPSAEDDQREAQHRDRHEQDRRVPLHAAGLHVPQQPAGLTTRLGDTVDRTVDHALVDDVVGEATDGP